MTQLLKIYNCARTFPLSWQANSEHLYDLLHTIDTCPDDESALTHLIKTNHRKDREIYFIVSDDDTLIGAIVLKNDIDRRVATIQDVAVVDTHRRQGHAEKALRGLIKSRSPLWTFKLRVGYTTVEGERLFSKLGFYVTKVEWSMITPKETLTVH